MYIKRKKRLTELLILICVACLIIFAASCKKSGGAGDKNVQGNAGEQPKPSLKSIEIKGQVKLANTEDCEGITVYASGSSISTRTDSKGFFSFPNIVKGKYEFFAEKSGYQTEKFLLIDVNDKVLQASTPIITEILVLQPVKSDEGMKMLSNITGYASLEGETKHSGIIVKIKESNIKTVTDDLGEYNFHNLEPGVYTFIFSHDDFKTEEYSQEVGPGTNIQLKESILLKRTEIKEKGKRLSGTIEIFDQNGNPMNNFSEIIVSLEGTSFVAVPDSAGKFMFANLPAGQYTVNASGTNFVNRNKADIDLTSNDSATVALYLDMKKPENASGSVTGTVSVDGETIDASDITVGLIGTSFVAVPASNGEFKITGITEGTYSFIAKADGFNSVKIENINVKAGEDSAVGQVILQKKIEPPVIQYTDPANGQNDVIIKKQVPVFIRFSKKMRPETVKSAFSITPSVEYTSYMGRENPQSDFDLLYVVLSGTSETNPLKFKTKYKITINTSAQDYEGANLEESYDFSFSTRSAAIIKTFPANGERDAFLNEANPIVITFNTKIKYDTFSDSNITIEPAPRSTTRYFFREDIETGWTEAYIYATVEFNQNYTVVLGRGIKAANGDMMSNTPYRLKFKTAKLIEAKTGFESK